MSALRGFAWLAVALGFVLPEGVSAAQPDAKKLNKVMIQPAEGETTAQLKQRGVATVDDYGSYWIAEATDEQVAALQKSHGERAVKANYLNRIELSAVPVDTNVGEPSVPSDLHQSETSGKRLRLIQFKGAVQPQWLDKVKAAGDVRVISYVPDNSYIVWTDASAEQKLRELLDPQGPLQSIGAYHSDSRIPQDLRVSSGGEPIKVRVAVVDDSQETLTMRRILALGLVENSFAHNGQKILSMELLPSVVSQIAQLPAVLWIEKVYPKRLMDEVQDLIVASQTNGPGHGPSASTATNYLNFLINNVGGGLASFQNQFTYPIVDVADTGFDGTIFEQYPNSALQSSFNEFGLAGGVSRVAYLRPGNQGYFVSATIDSGCAALNLNFDGPEDFYDHGTRVASVIAGYDTDSDRFVSCIVTTVQSFTSYGSDPSTCPELGRDTITYFFHNTVCPSVVRPRPSCTGSSPIAPITLDLPTEVKFEYIEPHRDANHFQFGLGISPFGRIGSSRIWRHNADQIGTPPVVRFVPVLSLTPCLEGLYPYLFFEAYSNGARIQNNSWSEDITVTGANGGVYDGNAQVFDTAVRDALLVGSSNNVPGPSALNQEFIIVFAANQVLTDYGASGNVGGFGDIRVTPPATAKNVITVGSSESVRSVLESCAVPADVNDSFDIWERSAFGPTLDGRFKPEIVAPGTSIWAAKSELGAYVDTATGITPMYNRDICGNVGDQSQLKSYNPASQTGGTNCDGTSSLTYHSQLLGTGGGVTYVAADPDHPLYDCSSGSSYAAPAVSGAIQLLWWYFQNRLTNEVGHALFQPSPAMAKAYLCNSARYLPLSDPEYPTVLDTLPSIAQGMGELDLRRMFDGVKRVIRDESTPRALAVDKITTNPAPQQTYFSQANQSYEVSGEVASSEFPFRVTIAWTDTPGNPGPTNQSKQLVNDLDLQVTIGGQTYKGNVFAEDHSVVGGVFDSVNNMESVFLPAGGAVISGAPYSVVVRATNIAGDGVPNVGSDLDQDFALVVYNSQNPSDVPNPAANNACQSAIAITTFPYRFSNNLNTTTYHNVHPSPSVARGGADEFFKIEAPTAGATITVDTFGSSFDTVLSVWRVQVVPQTVFVRAPCGALVELVSNDNAGGGQQSQVAFTADGSNTYYIVVEPRNGGSGGTMVLNVQASTLVTLSPTNLVFGSQFVGTTSAVQTVTFRNNATGPVEISDVTVGGANPLDFIVSGECLGSRVQPGGSCTITVAFSPTATGLRTGTLIVNDDALGSPHTVLLSGTGLTPLPAVCSSAGSLSFGSVTVGFPSAAKSVTITNCGSAPLVISNSATITGANASDFAIDSDLCSGRSITPGGSCAIDVTFTPLTNGSKTANLTFSDNTVDSPHTVLLSGTAVSPAPRVCLSASSSAFGNVGIGATSAPPASVIVSNCGSAPLSITGVSLSGPGKGHFQKISDGCSGNTIAAGDVCAIQVVYVPTNIGSATATLTVVDNAAGSPHSVALSGNSSVSGSQPDLAIGKNRNLKRFIGRGVQTPPTPIDKQSLLQKIGGGKKRVYYVAFKNNGTSADTILVGAQETVNGASVKYFLGAFPADSVEVTDAVQAGTFSTGQLAPGAFTGDATWLRVEITTEKTAPRGTNTVVLTGTSVANPGSSDSIRAVAVR